MARFLLGKLVGATGKTEDFFTVARLFGRLRYELGPVAKRLSRQHGKGLHDVIVRRIKNGVDAYGVPLAPLTAATLNSYVVDEFGNQIGKRRDYGTTPMHATGETVKSIKARQERYGFSVMIDNPRARRIVAWHYMDVVLNVTERMRKQLHTVRNIHLGKEKTIIERPARRLIGLSREDLHSMAADYREAVTGLLRRRK